MRLRARARGFRGRRDEDHRPAPPALIADPEFLSRRLYDQMARALARRPPPPCCCRPFPVLRGGGLLGSPPPRRRRRPPGRRVRGGGGGGGGGARAGAATRERAGRGRIRHRSAAAGVGTAASVTPARLVRGLPSATIAASRSFNAPTGRARLAIMVGTDGACRELPDQRSSGDPTSIGRFARSSVRECRCVPARDTSGRLSVSGSIT